MRPGKMQHLWRFIHISVTLLIVSGSCWADIIQDFMADEGTLPGTLIGRIDLPNEAFVDIPKPPYIIMAYQESVERDLAINENTGEIRAKVPLDREVTDFYSFMAVPLLGGSNIRVKITLQDTNDHSPAFKEDLVKIEFSESQPRDTRRSLPPATDLDVGINTTQRYEIVSGNINNVFRLSSRRGRDGVLYLDLEINGVLDRETTDNYLLVVEAYDGGNPPRSGRLRVNITLLDDNDNQPLFTESRYHASLFENTTIGTAVLQVEATDADEGRNAQIFYSINRRVTDSEHVFDIDVSTGVVFLSKNLDYEKKASYELVITARDNGSQPLESTTFVYLEVQNVNDRYPVIEIVFLNNGTGLVSEGALVGDFVARLSVSDEDSAAGDAKIALKMTGGMDKFELLPESESVYMLRVKSALDFEERDNYTLLVVASDQGQPPLSTEKTITIFLQDVNDNVPIFDKAIYNVETLESVENGTVLLLASAIDQDFGDNALVEYFLPNAGTGKIKIDPKTGVISASVTWDCQGEHTESILIAARDHGMPSLTSTAVVQLSFRSDSDVAPVFEKTFYNVSLGAEDVHTGNCFLKVRADGSGCSSSGKIHYSIHPSWSDEYFQINRETGQVCLLRNLDHVRTPVRQLLVQASDKSNASTTAFVQIYLPPISIFRGRYFVTDIFHTGLHSMTPLGSPVVQLRPEEEAATIEDESGWRFVYSMVGGNDNQLFEVDPRTGLIQVANSLLDHVGLHKLLVSVEETSTAAKLPVVQLQVFVKVDTQEPFFAAKIFKLAVGEDAPVGTAVAESLQVLPKHPRLKFLIQPPGSQAFQVDPDTGLVRTKIPLDRDVQAWYVFNVIAQYPDSAGQDTAQVMITVGDMDDNLPVFRTSQVALHVPETATGDAIFQASAFDGDGRYRRPLHYTMTSGSQEHFHLDQSSGLLTIAKALDYETASVHELSIHAIELGAPLPSHATLRLRVHVIDRNDHSPVFENSTYQVEIQENAVVGSVLLKVKASDADSGKSGRVTYQINSISDAETVFGIYPQTGEVYLRQELDREKQDVFVFHVQASDHGRPQFKSLATIKVNVLDFNDNAPVFSSSQYSFTLLENTVAGAWLGKVQAIDSDFGANGQVKYQLSCNESLIEINETSGEILSKKTLDREEVSSYECTVTAMDFGSPPLEVTAAISVKVLDVNDNSPVFFLPVEAVVWVTEGEPEGTEILRAMATDADEGDFGRVTYSLNSDEDSYAFSIHPATGTIRSQVVLDHEKQSLFRLLIIAADRGTPARTTQKALTINVVDLNDNRPTFSTNVMTIEIMEGTAAGVEIGSVLAVDADSGDNGRVSYSIIRGNVFGAFDIGRTSGKIYTAREVDYELAPSYMLRVRAVDSSSTKPRSNLLVVNIIVIDVNDCAPKFANEMCLFSVKENIALGTTVWNFSASDADAGSFGQLTYDVSYQFPQTAFKIHPVTGALSVAEKIDYERHKNYSLVVTASDKDPEKSKRKTTSLKCLVVVQDENDHAPKFVSRNIVRIADNLPDGFPVTQMVALDEDSFSNGNVTYEITRGNEERAFVLNTLTGLISLNRPSSQVKSKACSLTIVATDNGTPRLATMQSVTIEIDSISNKIQVFNQTVYEVDVMEDVDVGVVLFKFDTPKNVNNSIRFSIPEEFLYQRFALDTGTGELRVTRNLDRETKDHYFMNIYATNKQNPLVYDFATIVMEIQDVNDNAPSFQDSCHGLTIGENNEFGPVHKFVAIDRDLEENGKISYRIESGNNDQKFFINPQNGELSAKPLDREEQDEYTLLIVAEDHGRPSRQSVCRMRIAVLDRNDNAPIFSKQSYNVNVPEDVPIGFTVIQVHAMDKDSGENSRITYQLRNDTQGLLQINDVTGVITTASILDRETLTEYLVEIVASDGSTSRSQSSKVLLRMKIDDVNDNQPEFSRFHYESKISEVVRSGQPVAKVMATDKDFGVNSHLVYGFAAAQKKFNIDSDTGIVTAKEDLRPDEQPGSLYRISVVATDQGKDVQKSSLGLLDIMVGDAPAEAVSLKFSLSSYAVSVAENSRVGTKIIHIMAARSDGQASKINYSIVDGNFGDVFELDKNSGVITVRHNTDLDYEKRRKFNLTVLAETEETIKLQEYATIVVSVTDENDNAPHFGQNKYASSVWEGNNKGTFVTQLFANDEDSGRNGELTYEIIDGNSEKAFVIDPPFSGIVKTNMVLDHEIVDSYKLTIVAKDAGVPRRTGTCTLKITIVDVNDNEPVFPHYGSINVSEGAALGSVIFSVAANDVDVNPEILYSIPGSGNKTFSINRQNGNIAVAAPLDREKQSRYVLTVEASDKVHSTRTNLTVIVKDENDNAPIFSQLKYEVSVPEMTPAGTAILSLPARDADEGENARIRFSIRIAPVAGFAINERTGVISTTKTVSFDPSHPPVILAVSAEDNGNPKLSSLAEVQIHITGVNRHAPVFKRTVYSVHVAEDVLLGQKVLQVSAHDPDVASGVTSVKYTMSGDPEGVFQIDGRSGNIIVVKKLDRETAANYVLRVVASDQGRPVRNSTAEVIVDVDDVNDNAAMWNQTEYKAFVSEALPRGTAVLQVKAMDLDAGENGTISYAILTGNEAGLFRINSVSGVIEINGNLDYETTSEYKLIIQATDSGRVRNQSSLTEAMLYLTDANDNAPFFAVNHYKESIAENSPVGTLIFTARAHDRDRGVHGKLRYSISSSEGLNEFDVEATSGKVTSKVLLDYETKQAYNFVVTATDSGGSRADVQVTVDIVSQDEFAPKFSQNGYRFFISPESKKDDVVGQVSATDPDAGSDGLVLFRFQNPSELLTINSSTGVITLLMDLQTENSTKTSTVDAFEKRVVRSVQPEISTLVIADSDKEGSKSDAALVTVIFGAPEQDLSQADAWQNTGSLLAGIIIASIVVLLVCLMAVFFCVRGRSKKVRNPQQYSNSFDVLQYAPFRGIDNASHGSNHYHDPGTRLPNGSDASVSSGRGSADDDGVLSHDGTHYYVSGGGRKARRCFPQAMPDSGLPDVDATGDYFTKVAIPPSAPGSHESIHRFDDELGGEEKYCQHDQERRSHGSSSASSVFQRRLPPTFPVHSTVLAGNEKFDYLMWLPEYAPMAAVYAEIAEFPQTNSERSSESQIQNPYAYDTSHAGSSTASVFFSKNSSQTTLPSMPPHLLQQNCGVRTQLASRSNNGNGSFNPMSYARK